MPYAKHIIPHLTNVTNKRASKNKKDAVDAGRVGAFYNNTSQKRKAAVAKAAEAKSAAAPTNNEQGVNEGADRLSRPIDDDEDAAKGDQVCVGEDDVKPTRKRRKVKETRTVRASVAAFVQVEEQGEKRGDSGGEGEFPKELMQNGSIVDEGKLAESDRGMVEGRDLAIVDILGETKKRARRIPSLLANAACCMQAGPSSVWREVTSS